MIVTNPRRKIIISFCFKLLADICKLKQKLIFTDITASLLLETICEKEERENQIVSSNQTITIKEKEDNQKHCKKTPDTIEQIDPTLECEYIHSNLNKRHSRKTNIYDKRQWK